MMTSPERLPPEATDDGERIVVAPDRGTRLWAVGGAVLAMAIGVGLLVTGDGGVMIVAGMAATVAGVYLLVAHAQRLEFDAETVRRRSLLRPTTVAWSEVTRAKVEQRYVRAPVAGSARRLGGLNLSMGAGNRRGGGLRRDQPIVVLSVEHEATGPELTMELNRSDIAQGEALLHTLIDRGWLPGDVTVSVDAER